MIETTQPSAAQMNEVICDFMGGYRQMRGIDIYKGPDEIEWETGEFLKYNTNWNWLMPVGKRCHDRMKQLPNEMIVSGFNTFWRIILAIQTWDIEKTHKAMYDFILWYNENQKQP